jgi:hypothetical protein
MTSDPDRLLRSASTGDGAELERELLRSIVDVSPPGGAREAAWRGISTQVAAASVVAAAATAAAYARAATQALPAAGAGATSLAPRAGTTLLHALTSKVVIGVVVAAGATTAIGGAWFAGTASTRPAPTAASAAPGAEPTSLPLPPAPARAQSATEEATPVVDSTKSSLARPSAPETARPARQRLDEALALESALVTQARADLKRGDPRAALATLQRLKRESPRGVLHQEREVLAVQALAAAGQKDAARARARAFIQSYPNSPHAPLLRSLASEP